LLLLLILFLQLQGLLDELRLRIAMERIRNPPGRAPADQRRRRPGALDAQARRNVGGVDRGGVF
jgi:hypothetical protein